MPKNQQPSHSHQLVLRLVVALISVSAIFQIVSSMESPVLSIYLLHLTGDLRHIGAVLALYSFSFALASTLAARFLVVHRFRMLYINYAGAVIYCLVMYSHPDTTTVYLTQIFGGSVGGIGYTALMDIFHRSLVKDSFTQYLTLNKLTGCITGGIAAAASGFIAHHLGVENVFLIMAVVSATSLLGSFYVKRRLAPHIPTQEKSPQ